MPLSSLLIFAGTLAVVVATPGPSITALVARVLASGWRKTLPFVAALWVGEAFWLTAAMLGLGALAREFHYGFLVLKFAGVAYLLYVAWKMWTSPSRLEDGSVTAQRTTLGLFWAGLAVSLGNPKTMVFYLALLPAILDLTQVTPLALAEILATMAVTFTVIDGAYLVLASQARGLLRSPRAVRIANRTGAVAMTGAAAAIAWDAA